MSIIQKLGISTINRFKYLQQLVIFFYFSIKVLIISRKARGYNVIKEIIKNQIIFTGYNALGAVTIIAIMLGVVVIVEASSYLPRVGAGGFLGNILVITIIREIGPIMTALIIIGRSSTAIATEIGNMRVAHEIEALEIMGINPLPYLSSTRIVGGFISTIVLTIYFDVISIVAGFFISQIIITMDLWQFLMNIVSALTVKDLLIALSKSAIFGIVIPLISCYHGFKVEFSPREVPKEVGGAVMNSFRFCLILNGLISIFSYLKI